MRPSLLLLERSSATIAGTRGVVIMVHARGTPDLFGAFPARYIMHVCVYNGSVRRRGRTVKIDEAEHTVYSIIPGLIHLCGTRLILGANPFYLASRGRVSTVSRRRERSPLFFTSLHLRRRRRRSSQPKRELVMPSH